MLRSVIDQTATLARNKGITFAEIHTYMARFKLCGVDRFQGQDTMELPSELTGRPIEVYVFVVAENGKAVSNSQYLGRLGEMS